MTMENNIIQKIMRHRQVVLTIFTVLTLVGVFALYKMPRQEFPEFTVRQGLVVGVFPGATPAQVEKQLTSKVEEYIFGFKEVDKSKTYSLSRENSMIIFVEVRGDIDRVDTDAFWVKLRHGLNDLKPTLPAGVISLFANNDFGDTAAVILALSSDSKSYKELEPHMEALEDELRKLDAVSKIKHQGLQREQIGIYIDDAKLALYGIKPLTLLSALKTESAVNYAGELDNGKIVMPIHIPGRYHSENDLAEQIIYSDPAGNIIRLKDVARIIREYADPDSYITVDGKKAVIITLEMQFGNNIVHFGKKVDTVINRFAKTLPDDIHINKVTDMPLAVDNAVGSFLTEFFIAIIAVIIITILLLPRKIALISAISIPISVFITLAILYAIGVELHTVSLAALIVVLGMVVDNGIVVIDNHIEKLDNGFSPWDAAWKSATELFIPIVTATLAIIAVFVPLPFFLTGIGNDFIKTFPLTLGIALTISFMVGVFFIPVINFMYIKEGLKDRKVTRRTFLDRMQSFYDRTFEITFKKPKTTVFIGLLSIAISVYLLLLIPREVYPLVERNQFALEIYLPSGTSLKRTEHIVNDLEYILKNDKRVTMITSFIGTSSPRFHATYAPNMPAKNYAQLIVATISNQATIDILNEYNEKYRNDYPEAYVRWKQLAMNFTKAPIEVRVSGNNLNALKETASQVTDIIKNTDHVAWIRNNFEESIQLTPSSQRISLDIKKDEANRLGFTRTILAYSLMIGTKGLPLSTIWEGNYPVNVMLHVDRKQKQTLDDILNQYVTSPFLMSSAHLRQLVEIKPAWSSHQIVRRNGVRTITVAVDVDRNVYASNVLKVIKPQIEKLDLPENVDVAFGGEYEGEIQDYVPMSYALTVGIIINFFILLFQFKTIKTSLLVMSTLLLSLLGAAVGLLSIGFPFGFTSFIGVMGLSGLVIRNGVILVDYANSLIRESGFSVKEAALLAGKRRLRPIFLTSVTTAIGVIPTIIRRSLLWGPLASVICFGLLFAMVLTLYILPVLYMYVYESETIPADAALRVAYES